MPPELVKDMLSDRNIYKRLQFQMVLQCAPLLKGIKAACMMNVNRNDVDQWSVILADTGIEHKVLTTCNGRCLIIFYREPELKKRLGSREISRFLEEFGYDGPDLEGVLERLAERVRECSGASLCFPHEIGVFLDYPLEDIRGFIQNGGKRYLKTGYWKVYHNLEHAEHTFRKYDRAKDCAVREFLVGKHLRDITVRTS